MEGGWITFMENREAKKKLHKILPVTSLQLLSTLRIKPEQYLKNSMLSISSLAYGGVAQPESTRFSEAGSSSILISTKDEKKNELNTALAHSSCG